MARNEQTREDLLREATALVERAELSMPGYAEPIVVGFRSDGAPSFFFGADPVFQFNQAGELRRAYRNGRMLKAEKGALVELNRLRTPGQVQLVRHQLSSEEAECCLSDMRAAISALHTSLLQGTVVVRGMVPAEGRTITRIAEWCDQHLQKIRIANIPNVSKSR